MVEGRSSSGTGGDPSEKSGSSRANGSSTGERFKEFDKGEIPVQRLLVRGAGRIQHLQKGGIHQKRVYSRGLGVLCRGQGSKYQ